MKNRAIVLLILCFVLTGISFALSEERVPIAANTLISHSEEKSAARDKSKSLVLVYGQIAWGEVVNGLQMGLSHEHSSECIDLHFRNSVNGRIDETKIPQSPQGVTVHSAVYLRNAGKKTIKLEHSGIGGATPTLTDSSGKNVYLYERETHGPILMRTLSLKPGETIRFGRVRFKPEPGTNLKDKFTDPHAYIKPGFYHVRQSFRFHDRPGDSWQGVLVTGKLPIEIVEEIREKKVYPKEDEVIAGAGVNVYLLEDDRMDLKAALEMPISRLPLRKKPWIASDNIFRYEASTHSLYLKKDAPMELEYLLPGGNPFVVTADGQRCCVGALGGSVIRNEPEANVPLIRSSLTPGVIAFGLGRLTLPDDKIKQPRNVLNDKRVLDVFRKNGKYHAGIQLSLKYIDYFTNLENSKKSLTFTYTLSNKDRDDYYVYDPAKMGNDLFLHFTNSPIWCPYNGKSPESFVRPKSSKTVKVPETTDKAQMGWLTLLKSGESMTRTVTKDAYPEIGPGEYEWTFLFPSPGWELTEQQRQKKDARIWVGQLRARLSMSIGPVIICPPDKHHKVVPFKIDSAVPSGQGK